MKSKLPFMTLAIGAACSVSSLAGAQESFGDRGNISLGLDRGFGFYFNDQNLEAGGFDLDQDTNVFGFAWGAGNILSPLQATRFAFDIFVIDKLSVGGSLGFATLGGDADGTIFLLAPRVGYFIGFNHMFGFWPRGGFTFYSANDPDAHQFLFTAEGMFTFSPAGQWAFTFGPTIDLGITGEAGDADFTEHNFGIAVGMLGWL